jgi:rubrerythrin
MLYQGHQFVYRANSMGMEGFQNNQFAGYHKFMKNLKQGIQGEANAIKFYSQLLREAETSEAKEICEHALEDEQRHYRLFEIIYRDITGKAPQVVPEEMVYSSFNEAIRSAYKDELEAYKLYRDTYLLTRNPSIRDSFFLAMTDEMEHANKFSYLLNRL